VEILKREEKDSKGKETVGCGPFGQRRNVQMRPKTTPKSRIKISNIFG
jgi:hypothetical protein